VTALQLSTLRPNLPQKAVFALVAAVVAASAAAAVVAAPLPALLIGIGVPLVALTVRHLIVAVAVLSASFYFDNYLTGGTLHLRPELTDSLAAAGLDGFVNLSKLIGVVALLAWAVAWLSRRTSIRTTPHLAVIGGLSLVLLASMALAHDEARALLVASRYVMYFGLFFLIVQAVTERRHARLLVDVIIGASGVASLVALLAYFGGHVDRASGPLSDPNDFGLVLACTIPLALYRLTGRSTPARIWTGICLVLISGAMLATFSRAALLGLIVAAVWAVATGRLRLRWAAMAMAAVVTAGAVAWQVEPDLFEQTLQQKQFVAQRNVDSRLVFWQVAVEEWETSPLLGVGPGNYESRFGEFRPYVGDEPPTTHNAYLHVLAELGLAGLAFFVGYLALAWAWLRRRVPGDPELDQLLGALAAGFVVKLVGAFFMTQQFYPPMWFFPALGAALLLSERRVRGGPAAAPARAG
jgi:O-antigen ligase